MPTACHPRCSSDGTACRWPLLQWQQWHCSWCRGTAEAELHLCTGGRRGGGEVKDYATVYCSCVVGELCKTPQCCCKLDVSSEGSQ
jgi:hypothetical protein